MHPLSLAEFLAWEELQAARDEFFRGKVVDMACSTRGHGRVITNLARHLGRHLDATRCQPFLQGMKVQVGDEAVLYPDVFVTCDERFAADDPVVTAPVLVIEVLSPSTQRYDRSEKFAIYRKLPSLREYVLIDPDTRRVEVFRPQSDGSWSFRDMTEGGRLVLASIELELDLAQVFKGMDSDEAPAA